MLEIEIEENAYGATRPVEVVADAPISALVPALVEELRLPRTDLFGNRLGYTLRYASGGRPLPEHQTLAAAGVTAGARLALEPYTPNMITPAAMARSTPAPAPVIPQAQNAFYSDMTMADNSGFAMQAQSISRPLEDLRQPPRRSRRAFLVLGGAVLGAGSLGLGYAAYQSYKSGGLAFLNSLTMTHTAPKQQTRPAPTNAPTRTTVPTMAQAQVRFTQHQQMVRTVTWSPDATMLASGSLDGNVLIWTAQGNTLRSRPQAGPVRAVVWSPDNQQLAIGASNQVSFLNAATGALLARSTHRHTNVVTSLTWSNHGALRLLSTAADNHAVVWNGMNHQAQVTFALHGSAVQDGSWAPDGQTVATSSSGGFVRVWNAATAREVHGYYQDTQTPTMALAFAPTGMQLAVGGNDGLVRLWDGLTCQQQVQTGFGPRCIDMPQHLRAHTKAVRSLAWSADGRFLASGGDDGLLAIWYPAQSHTPIITVQQNASVRAVRWSPNGLQIATASGTTVTLWTLK